MAGSDGWWVGTGNQPAACGRLDSIQCRASDDINETLKLVSITVVISLDKKSELPAVLFRFRPYKQLQRITTVQWPNFSMDLITIQQAAPEFSVDLAP